jgi:septum formation protein
MMSRPRLVLASGSPRRRDLLAALGLSFTVRPADLDESQLPGEDPEAYVLRLARDKARADARPGELVLAADTTVVLAGEVLGKPADADEAAAMLRRLAGQTHRVLSGIALFDASADRMAAAVDRTEVEITSMSDSEIAWYVATGEPMDKAGAYAAQGLGSLFVGRVRGNHYNVVGLPVPEVYRLFARLGHDLLSFRSGGSP